MPEGAPSSFGQGKLLRIFSSERFAALSAAATDFFRLGKNDHPIAANLCYKLPRLLP